MTPLVAQLEEIELEPGQAEEQHLLTANDLLAPEREPFEVVFVTLPAEEGKVRGGSL